MENANATPNVANGGVKPTIKPQCDLVMKGGITSGIVYPPALVELHKAYTFNSIGGTSAGAIAAAAAAAAEYGDRKDPTSETQGFHKLTKVSNAFNPQPSPETEESTTASKPKDPKKLFKLFQAPKATRVVMKVAEAVGSFGGSVPKKDLKSLRDKLATFGHNFSVPFKVIGALFTSYPFRAFLGLILGGLLGWVVVGFGVLSAFNDLDPNGRLPLPPESILAVASVLLVATLTWLLSDTDNSTRLRHVGIATAVTLLIAFLLLWAVPWAFTWGRYTSDAAITSFFTVLLALVGGITFVLFHLISGVLGKAVPDNFYGIVNGHDEDIDRGNDPDYPVRPNSAKATHLTDWLCASIDEIAGLDKIGGVNANKPLTFGDLCDAGITLKMISTNLSLGIPYELPFEDEDIFIFDETEMRRLFPDYIVRHLIACSNKHDQHSELIQRLSKRLPPNYHFLPPARDLPVVLATRMSLAVPLFLSAIPLYTLSAQGYRVYEQNKNQDGPPFKPYTSREKGVKNHPDNDLLLHHFSDGGTTSNFPIHFFDGWLPTRPTFGITLTSMPANSVIKSGDEAEKYLDDYFPAMSGASPANTGSGGDGRILNLAYLSAHIPSRGANSQDSEDGVLERDMPNIRSDAGRDPATLALTVLPRVDQVALHEWSPIESPFSLLGKVLSTARENHDILQSQLPGYRDRIIQVRLEKEEGGMNLLMTPADISSVVVKGKEAGEKLRCDFDFKQHQWARFRVLMARLEDELEKMAFTLTNPEYGYSKLIWPQAGGPAAQYDYTPSKEDCSESAQPALPISLPYEQEPEWRSEALLRVLDLVEVVERWRESEYPSDNLVSPDATKRLLAEQKLQEMETNLEKWAQWAKNKKVSKDGLCKDGSPRQINECDPTMPVPKLNFFSDQCPEPKSTLRVAPQL